MNNPSADEAVAAAMAHLRQLLSDHFSVPELRALIFDLGIDHEEIAGDTKSEKIISLVSYAKRDNKLASLVRLCQKRRPFANWPPFPPAAPPLHTTSHDPFSHYEVGLQKLNGMLGPHHPRYSDFLAYQQRLMEPIAQARRYGDNEGHRSARAEIIEQLNQLALASCNISFNELCQ